MTPSLSDRACGTERTRFWTGRSGQAPAEAAVPRVTLQRTRGAVTAAGVAVAASTGG